jgi:hypothetical protein
MIDIFSAPCRWHDRFTGVSWVDEVTSERLAQDLLAEMSQFAKDGSVVEVIESQALIARRES